MVSPSVVALTLALSAFAAATNVLQCPGKSIQGLSNDVQLSCSKVPCKLKKGKNTGISITFTPERDTTNVVNKVSADLFGINVPFIGVDGNSICDKLYTESGEKTSCPIKAGTKYTYKDSFPILSLYPSVTVKVHWQLQSHENNDLACFEVPATIA